MQPTARISTLLGLTIMSLPLLASASAIPTVFAPRQVEVDVGQLQQLANTISSGISSIQSTAGSINAQTQSVLSGGFQGSAAQALASSLDQFNGDVSNAVDSLNAMLGAIQSMSDSLGSADEDATSVFG